MKRFLALCVVLMGVIGTGIQAQKREVHILSANDMHANIQAFPQLAAITDSLRALYPSLLLLSAGDNRTGEPINDIYEIPAYPMVALMNQVGFDASTLGNHEFDSGAQGLGRLTSLANFPHLCANIHPDPALGIHTRPCQVFDVDGVKVGVLGIVQVGAQGIPDCHPDKCKGIAFSPVEETLQQYRWLRDQCDVVVLLTHIGYDADVALSPQVPWADVIVGGHSHTQLAGGEMHSGILITQNENRLKRVTHITITLDGDKIVNRQAENIEVATCSSRNKVVDNMVQFFNSNPEFGRTLCQLQQPITQYEEMGCLMCDALRGATGADVVLVNRGGVRTETHDAGPFTVTDVLQLDPFGNDAVEMMLTGDELKQMMISCSRNDKYGMPCVSGVNVEYTTAPTDTMQVKDARLFMPDGKKMPPKKRYRVVTNSYTATICDAPRKDAGTSLHQTTSDLMIQYLEKQQAINYQGACRVRRVK